MQSEFSIRQRPFDALRWLLVALALMLLGAGPEGFGGPFYTPAFKDTEHELRDRLSGALYYAKYMSHTGPDESLLRALRRLEAEFLLDLEYRRLRNALARERPELAERLRIGEPKGVSSVPYAKQSLREALAAAPYKDFLLPVYVQFAETLRHAAAQCLPRQRKQNIALLDFAGSQAWHARFQSLPYELALELREFDCIDEATFSRRSAPHIPLLVGQLKGFATPGDRIRPLYLLAAGGLLDAVGESALTLVRLQSVDGSWPSPQPDQLNTVAVMGAYVTAVMLRDRGAPPRQADLLDNKMPLLPTSPWRPFAPP